MRLFDDRGHLTEIALVALADGQLEILSSEARAHAEACDACAGELADLALQSAAIGRALEVARADVRAPRKLPVAAIAIALAVAIVGALPSLLDLGWLGRALGAPHALLHLSSELAPALRLLARGPAGTAATFAAAALLALFGVLVARHRRDLEVES